MYDVKRENSSKGEVGNFSDAPTAFHKASSGAVTSAVARSQTMTTLRPIMDRLMRVITVLKIRHY